MLRHCVRRPSTFHTHTHAYILTCTSVNKMVDLTLGTEVRKVLMLSILLMRSAVLWSMLTLSAWLLLNMQMFPALQTHTHTHTQTQFNLCLEHNVNRRETHTSSEASKFKLYFFSISLHQMRAHTHTHLQDNDCGDECTPVEGSSATVNGRSLFLIHLPTTVVTAPTARQEETNYGHQNDVQDTNGYTHQETHTIHQ